MSLAKHFMEMEPLNPNHKPWAQAHYYLPFTREET